MTFSRLGIFLLPFLLPLLLLSQGKEEGSASELQVHRWLNDLSGSDWILQSVALEELGKRKVQSALPRIREVLQSEASPWIRGRAMLALGMISGKEIIPLARKSTQDKDPILRISALRTLESVGAGGSAELALGLMKDPVMEVRATAAALYAKEYPAQAWPTVETLTRLDSESVSGGLLRALSHIGTAQALERLRELFEDTNGTRERRRQVIKALGSADDQAIPLLSELTVRFPGGSPEFEMGAKLLRLRPRSKTSAVLKSMALDADQSDLASVASLIAGVCPTVELGDELMKSWTKRTLPLEAVRSCMVALSKIDPARYEAYFTKHLVSEDVPTRALAVSCRALVPDPALFETFRPFVNDPEKEIVLVALNGLRKTPEGTGPKEGLVSYLAPSFKSEEVRVLEAALNLLGERASEKDFEGALQLLTPLLAGKNKTSRKASADSLAKFCPPERLGDLAIAQGFAGSWKVVGPFANDRYNKGFAEAYGPETDWDAGNYKAKYRWEFGGGNEERELDLSWVGTAPENAEGEIHLAARMQVPVKYAVAYAKTEVLSDKEREVRLSIELREETAQSIWLNGKEVVKYAVQRNELGGSAEQRRLGIPHRSKSVKVRLSEGTNEVVIKSSTFGGDWRISLRIMELKEDRIAEGISLPSFKPPKEG